MFVYLVCIMFLVGLLLQAEPLPVSRGVTSVNLRFRSAQHGIAMDATVAGRSDTRYRALEFNSKGNEYLRNGDVDNAIACYTTALEVERAQYPVIYVMRSTAYLQRAYDYKMRFKDMCKMIKQALPTAESIKLYFQLTGSLPGSIRHYCWSNQLGKVHQLYAQLDQAPNWGSIKGGWQEAKEGEMVTTGEELLSRARYLWSLHEYALHAALEDSLSATLLRPDLAPAWRRAADVLVEMGRYARAGEYYGAAVALDPTLNATLLATMQRMHSLARTSMGGV